MNPPLPSLQIHIHKVDGSITTFIQPDAAKVKALLDGFQPAEIFNRERFVFSDATSITSLPVSKITRIDLISEGRSHLVFPVGIVDAVEMTESEFRTAIRNPAMREQWEQMTTQDDSLVTFMDMELADGHGLFLTTEMHVELQSEERWKTSGYPLEGSGLCFRMRNGGVAVLNLANLVRLTFFPKPVHPPETEWPTGQFCSPPRAAQFAGRQTEAPVAGSVAATFRAADEPANFLRP